MAGQIVYGNRLMHRIHTYSTPFQSVLKWSLNSIHDILKKSLAERQYLPRTRCDNTRYRSCFPLLNIMIHIYNHLSNETSTMSPGYTAMTKSWCWVSEKLFHLFILADTVNLINAKPVHTRMRLDKENFITGHKKQDEGKYNNSYVSCKCGPQIDIRYLSKLVMYGWVDPRVNLSPRQNLFAINTHMADTLK